MPKVVLIPGFTQTSSSWSGVAEIARESCELLPLEVPVRETFALTAQALAARGKSAVYVGYSMGGRLALRLALDFPEVVRALVLVSASPGIPDPAEREARVVADEALAQAVERDGVDAFLETWLAQPLFATVPDDAPGLAERHALSPGYLAHCLRVLGAGAMEPMWPRLGELQMPVAIVNGRFDAKYEKIALQMYERITSDVVHTPLDCGHAVPLEQPAVLGGFVAAFADRHG